MSNDDQLEKDKLKLERYKAQRDYDNQTSQADLEKQKLALERDKAQRDYDNQTSQADLEKQKLELERYKAQRDFKKFVLGSVFVALAVAAIPPLFQLATAVLEYVKSEQKLRIDQLTRMLTGKRSSRNSVMAISKNS